MNDDAAFYTATMAKVYAEQGNLERAAEIYRFLLKSDPGRAELVTALLEIEQKLIPGRGRTWEELLPLFEEWIDLLLRCGNMRRLKKLRQLSG